MSLQNRFKELRRTPTKRKESSSIQKEVIKKPMILNKVELFPGEDDVSHERHIKTLKAEYKKTKRNPEVVETLMSRTFPKRRNGMKNPSQTLETIFSNSTARK